MGLIKSKFIDLLVGASPGDILYRGASAWQRLPKGSDGQILKLVSGSPNWSDASESSELIAMKTSDQSISNTTSFQDANMGLNVVAGTYLVSINLITYIQDGGINFNLTIPSGTTYFLQSMYIGNLYSSISGNDITNFWISSNTYHTCIKIEGLITFINGGVFSLLWAQKTSHSNPTILYKGSSCKLTKV